MRAAIVVLIALAVVAAGGVAFFANRLVTPQKASMPTAQQALTASAEVLVAQSAVEPGAAIGRGVLAWVPWPEDKAKGDLVAVRAADGDVDAAKAAAEKSFEGMSARRAIAAGEPLTLAKVFKRDGATFMPGAVRDGMRAVSISVDAEKGVGGFVLPGDFVDVIVAHDVSKSLPRAMEEAATEAGFARLAAEVIAADVRVLAVDQTIHQEAGEGSAVVVKTVTLEVSPQQAGAVALAARMGELALALRPLGDHGPVAADARAVTDMGISPTLSSAIGHGVSRRDGTAAEGEESLGPPAAWTVRVNRAGKVDQVQGY